MTGVVVISGANRGIGLGLAHEYLTSGWRVHALCREPAAAPALRRIADTCDRLTVHAVDVTRPEQVDGLVRDVGAGPVDVLINNAAWYGPRGRSLWDVSADAWEYAHRVNVIGPFLLARGLLTALRRARRPVVANMSSVQASFGRHHAGAKYPYRTTKAALNVLTRGLASEPTLQDIIWIALEPGWVKTRMGRPGASITVQTSSAGLRAVLDSVGPEHSGSFLRYTGEEVPW